MTLWGNVNAQWTANGTHIYNTNTGKVGIGTGTTIPSGVLTVKGSGGVPASSWVSAGAPLFTGFGEQTVGNADYILSLASTLANARPVFIGRRSKGSLATPAAVANNDFLMSFLASGYDGSSFQNPAGIDFYVDGAPLLGSVPARISFVTGSNSATRQERLKIGATGNIVFNNTQLFLDNGSGNVGIGTIAPSTKLEVAGQVKITGGAPGLGKVLTSDLSGLASWQTLPTGGSSQWISSGNEIYNNNSGNVGIGTTTPTRAKLEVNGVGFGGATSAIFGGDGTGISIQRNWTTTCDQLQVQLPVAKATQKGGVEEAAIAVPIQIYPNPFTSTFDLTINAKSTTKAQVTIFNLVGVKMKTLPIINASKGSNQITVEGSSFAKGVYLVEVRMGAEKTIRKVIKL